MKSVSLVLLLARGIYAGPDSSCTQLGPQIRSVMTLLDQSRTSEAQALLSDASEASLPCPDRLLALARLRAAENKFDESGKLFTQFLETGPTNPEGPFYFGAMLLRIGYYPQAETLADRALTLNPSHVGALTLKGRLLLMRGQAAESQHTLERAIALDPKYAEAHFQLGTLFDRRKQHESALREFEAVTALTASDARAYDYMALNWEQLGDTIRAAKAFQRGLACNSGPLSDSFLDFNYGRFLLKQDRLQESREYLNRAVTVAPKVRAVLYERAKLLLRMGNFKDAVQDAVRALDTPDPGHVILDSQLYSLLAVSFSRLGSVEEADKFTRLAAETGIPPRSADRK